MGPGREEVAELPVVLDQRKASSKQQHRTEHLTALERYKVLDANRRRLDKLSRDGAAQCGKAEESKRERSKYRERESERERGGGVRKTQTAAGDRRQGPRSGGVTAKAADRRTRCLDTIG